MMKLFFSLVFVSGMAATTFANNPEGEVVKVNTTSSKVAWKGRKVTGKHNGSVNIKEGHLRIKDGKLIGGSFTMDMNSIKVLDLQGETAGKLEGHLKSDDFFGVATHPYARLTVTKSTPNGDGTFQVTGDLTIKDITHPVTFTTTLTPTGKKYTATANITIDRSKYNVRYGSGTFFENLGDKTIYDEFDLAISIVTE